MLQNKFILTDKKAKNKKVLKLRHILTTKHASIQHNLVFLY